MTTRSKSLRLGGLVFLGSLLVGLSASWAAKQSAYSWFDPVVDVYAVLTQHYVEEPDKKAMLEGAIAGMVESVGDPYTEFVPTRDTAEFDKQMRGQYVGVGAEVRMEDGWLVIVSPFEDAPAYRAGIMAGDRVVAIDGASTQNKDVEDCVALLTGQPGTKVTATIERAGKRFDVTMTRAQIQTPTVKGVHRVNDHWDFWLDRESKIAYVRMTQFTQAAGEDTERVLRDLAAQGMKGLVFDLRFNPGGLLSTAVDVSDLFLKNGVIVSTKGRTQGEQKFTAREGGTLPDFDMVVLINSRSASASEIVAGALSEQGRAVALGERTFGKGSVQTVLPLPSGAGQLKITEQYYYLPSGRLIHRKDDSTVWGVDPTPGFYVPMTDDEYSSMLLARREEEIVRPRDGNGENWGEASWVLARLKDKQLAAAVEALRAKQTTGEWPEVGGVEPKQEAVHGEARRLEQVRERLLREMERVDRRLAALEEAGAKADPVSVLPENVELSGGELIVRDAKGNEVARLRITGEGLGRWLLDAPVESADKPQPVPPTTP